MSNLAAIIFQDVYAADEARAALRRIEGAGLIELGESATIVRTPEGKIRVSQDVDVVAQGQRAGHLAGIVAAAATGILPLMMVGTLGGRLMGRLRDHGITNQLIGRLSSEAGPGTSVLVLIGTSDAVRRKRVAEQLVRWGPTILETTLPPDLEEDLQKILDGHAAPGP